MKLTTRHPDPSHLSQVNEQSGFRVSTSEGMEDREACLRRQQERIDDCSSQIDRLSAGTQRFDDRHRAECRRQLDGLVAARDAAQSELNGLRDSAEESLQSLADQAQTIVARLSDRIQDFIARN